MRAYKMKHWKIDDWVSAIIGGASGCWAYIQGMPYLGFIQLLDTSWWHMAATKALDLVWSAIVAGTCAGTAWISKKVIEENWPKLKQSIRNFFKRKKNA